VSAEIVSDCDRINRIRDARLHYFETGVIDQVIRPEIGQSWERSSATCAPGKARFELIADLDPDTQMTRAARPVLRSIAARLAGTGVNLVLANENAVVVERWAENRRLMSELDRVRSVPGAMVDEARVGTNGVGSVITHGGPLVVYGPEHWADDFQHLASAAAPIRDVVTGRIQGAVALTSSIDASRPAALSLASEAARDIEQELMLGTTHAERALLDAFLAASCGSSKALIAVSQGLVIGSPAAVRMLERIDQSYLWERVAYSERKQQRDTLRFDSESGRVLAHVNPAGGERGRSGVVVEFAAQQPQNRASARDVVSDVSVPGLVGDSEPWRHVVHDLSRALANRKRLLVIGERGTGKLALTRALLDKDGVQPGNVDAALEAVDGTAQWLRQVRTALRGCFAALIIRHLERLSEEAAIALFALLEEEAGETTVIATCGSETGRQADTGALREQLGPLPITMPPLRRRPDDIGRLVQHFRAGRRCFSSEAMQVLLRYPWPGNVRELRDLIEALCCTASLDVAVADLPAEVRRYAARRQLTRLEELELAALYAALEETGGNKAAAADLLGVSRSTVYRRLANSGTDLDRRVY
jgi:transcriptional regulator of acetoin/glycerol metabolism